MRLLLAPPWLLLLLSAAVATVATPFPRRDTSAAYSYPHYPAREVYSLSGDWAFAFLNFSDWSANATALPADLSFDKTQSVPSAWDSEWGTGLQYSRGAGVYRAKVAIPAGKPAALHFEACSIFCRVFVDGKEVANSTAGGFTPFWVDVPPASVAERTLLVVASNVFDTTLTPTQAAYYDFYQYGGLIREVTLHVLPAVGSPSIGRVVVDPLAAAAGGAPSGKVNVAVVLRNAPPGKTVALGLCFDVEAAAPCAAEPKPYAHVNGVISLPAVAVPNFKVWSPAAPKLHTLTVAIHSSSSSSSATATGATDSILVRFGLRTVTAGGRHILINGQPTKLHGYNRHDMYPQLGPSLTPAIYDADIALLQGKLKGNFIRGSHYPQDPRFLDRCDEAGILVWEETLAWGNYEAVLTSAAFLGASLATAHAMLDRDTNHPSVILWGFFNEGQSDKNASCPSYAAMANAFKSRDATRLVTWADNRGQTGECYEHADVISNNYYPGWYNGPASGIQKTWSDRASWVAATYPGKPFLISETGAGGIVGQHSSNGSRWSLEYQTTVDGDNARVAMSDPNIGGLALWQFCDIKVDQKNTSTGRPGGINNKGVVSRWREPKPSAPVVAAAYATAVPEPETA